ncbi:DsbA family protein [Rhodobaculum claviforme]|uniref:Thiol-disulfide oxidoreductase n=1 Tax=Rhodobaculum claviforme TaxID=1549854 RepID=A0A934TH15_9RHOB|nr:DsbA family protein [Rhodobaculum claviforme]MBK5926270.1 thiol-disulfide oxidoreductase [Rhodobaculum claviforme]
MIRRLAPAAIALAVAGGVGWWALAPSGTPALPSVAGPAAAQSAGPAEFERVPDMALGDADAPVTVIEYASFTCPHCATFHSNVLPQLKAAHIDTGNVRWIKREVYFDRPGLWAAMLARCGDDSRYFPMVDLLYQSQRDWAGSSDPAAIAEELRRLGRRTGLSNEEVDACLQDAEQAQAMVAVYQHHATEHGITSTPSFVIDGELHQNMGFQAFSDLIESRLGD